MTRILCLAILIGAIGFASDGFPISPRQNAIVGFITMSIPAFALALWAKPGQSPKASLTRRLAHFVIPAVLSICTVGFAVYIFTLTQSSDEYYARTMLTYFTVICGIILLIFVEPPTKWWAGGDVLSGDWRPTYLAIGLLALFVFCIVVPAAREFYGLTLLRQTSHYVIIALATIIWIFGLRLVWRRRLVERYLNLEHF
jgi:cation-transporting ATPase E